MAIRRYHLDAKSINIEHIAENVIQLAIPIHLLAKSVSVAIDSTGVKEESGRFKLPSEAVKHVKSGVFAAYADAPSATDASVDVELYNYTDGNQVAKVSFSGEGGYKETTITDTDLKALAGKEIGIRINVATASATAGATQTFRSAVLILILGVS